jgi:hypothetical protein
MDTLYKLLVAIESGDFISTTKSLEDEVMDFLSEEIPILVSTHFRGLLSKETIASIKEGTTNTIHSTNLDAWMVKHVTDAFLVRKPFGSKCGIDFMIVYYDKITIRFIRIFCSSSRSDRAEWESLPVPEEHCLYIHHDTKRDLVYAAMGKQLCDRTVYSYFKRKEEEVNRSLPPSGDWKVSFKPRIAGGPPFTKAMVTEAIDTLFEESRTERKQRAPSAERKQHTPSAERKRVLPSGTETKSDKDREQKIPPRSPDIEKLDESRSRGGYTKAELEAFCREYELPTAGNKHDLVERILEHLGE